MVYRLIKNTFARPIYTGTAGKSETSRVATGEDVYRRNEENERESFEGKGNKERMRDIEKGDIKDDQESERQGVKEIVERKSRA